MNKIFYLAPNITMPEAWAKSRAETEWEPLESEPPIGDAQLQQRVGLGLETCPLCGGNGFYYLDHRGLTTGLDRWRLYHPCQCRWLRWFWPRWLEVPPHDRKFADLATLAPTDKLELPADAQERVIDEMRSHPQASRIFLGPPRTGKTTFSTALYRGALEDDAQRARESAHLDSFDRRVECVWRVQAFDLLNQHLDRIRYDDKPEPVVTAAKVKRALRAGLTPRLFIEEFDKVKKSEYKDNVIFELIDSVYTAEGQVVITTNANVAEFKRLVGHAVLRRLQDLPLCQTHNFHKVHLARKAAQSAIQLSSGLSARDSASAH